MTYFKLSVQCFAYHCWSPCLLFLYILVNKGNNKITELRTILQRESQNS